MHENAPNPEAVEALSGHEKDFKENIKEIDALIGPHGQDDLYVAAARLRNALVLQERIQKTVLATVVAQVRENRERLARLERALGAIINVT